MFGLSLIEWTVIYIFSAIFVIVVMSVSLYLQIRHKKLEELDENYGYIPEQYLQTTKKLWFVDNFVLASVLTYYFFHKNFLQSGLLYTRSDSEHEALIFGVEVLEKLIAGVMVGHSFLLLFSLLLSCSVFILLRLNHDDHSEYMEHLISDTENKSEEIAAHPETVSKGGLDQGDEMLDSEWDDEVIKAEEDHADPVDIAPFRHLCLDGIGYVTLRYGDTWQIRNKDGSPLTSKELGFMSSDAQMLKISNANELKDIDQSRQRFNGAQIGHTTNSNGRTSHPRPVSLFQLILSCPELPEAIEIAGVSGLEIDGIDFPKEADNILTCEMFGNCTFAIFDGQVRELTLDISGDSHVNIELADDADKAAIIRLDVSGSGDINLSHCPAVNAELRISGSAEVSVDAEIVSGKVSGSADILLRKQSLQDNRLRTGGAAQVNYF